ncbi:DUF692 domain-containing protein [Novosphingobium sp. BK486]|uniref:MNIO family bufferin maturase n=1 Tax=unclassified Novosphingobium TaxID=2644732 RepID=UPI00351BC245
MVPHSSFAGFGLGLRKPHYADFLKAAVPVDFVEVISENFMVPGGRPRRILHQVRAHYPVALHGVSLSVGSAHGLDAAYLARLRGLVDEIEPLFVSDHLSWSRTPGFNAHDLLPLPYTAEALDIVCANLAHAQECLGRAMLIENPSSYLAFAQSDMAEWEFLERVCARTGCGLLLDLNNIHVSAINHGFDPLAYLAGVPLDRVRQIHLAGHSQGETLLIDTHDQPVPPSVWTLFAQVIDRLGPVAVMIERDDNIPPLADLLAELDQARSLARRGIAA